MSSHRHPVSSEMVRKPPRSAHRAHWSLIQPEDSAMRTKPSMVPRKNATVSRGHSVLHYLSLWASPIHKFEYRPGRQFRCLTINHDNLRASLSDINEGLRGANIRGALPGINHHYQCRTNHVDKATVSSRCQCQIRNALWSPWLYQEVLKAVCTLRCSYQRSYLASWRWP